MDHPEAGLHTGQQEVQTWEISQFETKVCSDIFFSIFYLILFSNKFNNISPPPVSMTLCRRGPRGGGGGGGEGGGGLG